jgi:predicted nucleic acid-binding protein
VRVLVDTSLLIEGERRQFDLGTWAERYDHEILICDAGVTEYLAGRPVKDEAKAARFDAYWQSFLALLPSVPLDREVCERAGDLLANARQKGNTLPLGDGLHGAVAELEGLHVATTDVYHFGALGLAAFNPLENPSGEAAAGQSVEPDEAPQG